MSVNRQPLLQPRLCSAGSSLISTEGCEKLEKAIRDVKCSRGFRTLQQHMLLAALISFAVLCKPAFGSIHCRETYTVQSGDTCSDVSDAVGVTQDTIIALNPGINCSSLKVGYALCIAGPPDTSTCSRLYQVKDGDTCEMIAAAAHLDKDKFLYINQHINCTGLIAGDQVCIAECKKYLVQAGARAATPRGIDKGRKVLVEYIGGTGNPIRMEDVPVRSDVDTYFVLSFAIDADPSGAVQNGSFSSYWISSITPSTILKIKEAHENVRVLLSLGGYSQYIADTGATRLINWYDPHPNRAWVEHAVQSITALVTSYGLDGIDIDYENFPQSKTFVECMGKVIRTLKNQNVIKIVTIAPYNVTLPLYKKLFKHHGHFIDYVNYQFYANRIMQVPEYVKLYNELTNIFPRDKLLPSLEVNGRGLQGQQFFNALIDLKNQHGCVPGMFLWSTDDSAGNGFLLEKVAQCNL